MSDDNDYSDLIEGVIKLMSHRDMKARLGHDGAVPFALIKGRANESRHYQWVDSAQSLDEQAQAVRELCIANGYYGFELRVATIGSGQEGGQLARDFEIVDIGWMK